jgi:hypothetical protein
MGGRSTAECKRPFDALPSRSCVAAAMCPHAPVTAAQHAASEPWTHEESEDGGRGETRRGAEARREDVQAAAENETSEDDAPKRRGNEDEDDEGRIYFWNTRGGKCL